MIFTKSNRTISSILLVIFILFAVAMFGCTRKDQQPSSKLQVVTTLFPLYDFARTIGGERAEVSMLLPPGMEPHSFEPKPNDILRISKAGLFIYTNRYMEPWAASMLASIGQGRPRVADGGRGVNYAAARAVDGHDHGGQAEHGVAEGAGGMDPHIWLDFANAATIVDNILAGFVSADPANERFYQDNAARLKIQLAELDQRYRDGLSSCETREFLHGGHFTFGYLARRYGLQYHSLSGVSSESEPSAAKMAAMVRQIKSSGVRFLFAEALLSPRMSETLAGEAGVTVLMLHGAHNLGRDDVARGVSFVTLMEQNLNNLQKGLACRKK
jgi:zinc transport system substrate-binding protein